MEEVKEIAAPFIHKLSLHILFTEVRRSQRNDSGLRRQPSALLSAYLDALPHALARDNAEEAEVSQAAISAIIHELVSTSNQNAIAPQHILPTLHQIGTRFSALCFEDPWPRKRAGCGGIRMMTCMPDLGIRWIMDREVDLVRTLLHILKDLPYDLPRDVDEVVDVLTRVLRVSNNHSDPRDSNHQRTKLFHLLNIFCLELSSPHPAVRQAAQTCIALLVELSGKPAVELLTPHRERTLAQIYTKPLRALPFPIQIGMMEAVRYCLTLDPPLAELNDELLRLLHETLGLADADDLTGFARGQAPRQNNIDIVKLRVSCIKLLTAALPITDYFVKQVQTRTRCVFLL